MGELDMHGPDHTVKHTEHMQLPTCAGQVRPTTDPNLREVPAVAALLTSEECFVSNLPEHYSVKD